MSLKELEGYKKKFLEGELSKAEEAEFKKILSESDRDEDAALQNYFHGVDKAHASAFTPVSKKQFFQRVSDRSTNRRRWYATSAAVTGLIVFCAGFYNLHMQKARQTARAEVDRSIETTRRALNAISIHVNSTVDGVSRGMDFSRPLGIFSELNNQLKKEGDAKSDETK